MNIASINNIVVCLLVRVIILYMYGTCSAAANNLHL